jgi:hypothetical protein
MDLKQAEAQWREQHGGRDPKRPELSAALARVRSALATHGLLYCQDKGAPAATTLIVGEPVSGSWWAHQKNKLIYDALGLLEADVAWVKLLSGKLTLVSEPLWPALVSVATSNAPFQLQGLSDLSRSLLAQVDRPRRADQLESSAAAKTVRDAVSKLEQRLLVYCRDEHTEHGNHVRVLIPWKTWQRERGITARSRPSLAEAQATFERAVNAWPGTRLPWRAKRGHG